MRMPPELKVLRGGEVELERQPGRGADSTATSTSSPFSSEPMHGHRGEGEAEGSAAEGADTLRPEAYMDTARATTPQETPDPAEAPFMPRDPRKCSFAYEDERLCGAWAVRDDISGWCAGHLKIGPEARREHAAERRAAKAQAEADIRERGMTEQGSEGGFGSVERDVSARGRAHWENPPGWDARGYREPDVIEHMALAEAFRVDLAARFGGRVPPDLTREESEEYWRIRSVWDALHPWPEDAFYRDLGAQSAECRVS
jgi:hypothetical protein